MIRPNSVSGGPGAAARVAVVGAGVAGLTAARTLARGGHAVALFDKGRVPGGRVATRTSRSAPGQHDHGAQYFTARDSRFVAELQRWSSAGLVAPWRPRVAAWTGVSFEQVHTDEAWYVGVPSMRSFAAGLAEGLEVTCGERVGALERDPGGWCVAGDRGSRYGPFRHVVVALPAPQAVPLLAASPALWAEARAASLAPCWAVLARYERALEVPFDVVRAERGPLAWAARESSKPGRPADESWVLHAAPEWSRAHLEDDPEKVARQLMAELAGLPGCRATPVAVTAHRWRYARPAGPFVYTHGSDLALGLSACGDWYAGARVEDAFLSGLTLGEELVAALRNPAIRG